MADIRSNDTVRVFDFSKSVDKKTEKKQILFKYNEIQIRQRLLADKKIFKKIYPERVRIVTILMGKTILSETRELDQEEYNLVLKSVAFLEERISVLGLDLSVQNEKRIEKQQEIILNEIKNIYNIKTEL